MPSPLNHNHLEAPDFNISPLMTNQSILEIMSSPLYSPLPKLSFAPSSDRRRYLGSIPPCATGPVSGRYKPLPFVPKDEMIPSKQILSVLELLERMDEDVIKEVRRVRESLQEAFDMVREYVDTENNRIAQQKERRERQEKDTKGVDDDFWLNA